jgi:hypothetical protein
VRTPLQLNFVSSLHCSILCKATSESLCEVQGSMKGTGAVLSNNEVALWLACAPSGAESSIDQAHATRVHVLVGMYMNERLPLGSSTPCSLFHFVDFLCFVRRHWFSQSRCCSFYLSTWFPRWPSHSLYCSLLLTLCLLKVRYPALLAPQFLPLASRGHTLYKMATIFRFPVVDR